MFLPASVHRKTVGGEVWKAPADFTKSVEILCRELPRPGRGVRPNFPFPAVRGFGGGFGELRGHQ